MTGISLRNLTKSYGVSGRAAVDNLSLEIEAGELAAVLGPSGCGKTTTLKMIAGLHSADSGEILFNGEPVTRIEPEKRDAVMVFQNHLLFPYMNVEENIGFGLKMRRIERAERRRRVNEMLSLVKLQGLGKRKPHELSGGEKQRAALARALAVRPGILLLDEPLSNLDVHLRDEMRELILRIHSEFGLTTVFVTHDQREAVQLADRIALMFDGRLQQFGPPEELYERPASRRIAAFFGGTNHIAGTKTGDKVSTAAGSFRVSNHTHVPDGPVQLLIRPEAIRAEGLPADSVPGSALGENCFSASILRRIYMGTCICRRIAAGDAEWSVIGPPHGLDEFEEGQTAIFSLPADRIWLLAEAEDIEGETSGHRHQESSEKS